MPCECRMIYLKLLTSLYIIHFIKILKVLFYLIIQYVTIIETFYGMDYFSRQYISQIFFLGH